MRSRVAVTVAAALALAGGGTLAYSLTRDDGAKVVEVSHSWSTGDVMSIGNVFEQASPGAVEFPVGTSYNEALAQLWLATATNRVPDDVRIVAPLKRGVVASTGDAKHGVVIDLGAPWGYNPETGRPLTPVIESAPAGLSPEEQERVLADTSSKGAWSKAARLPLVELPPCMREETNSRCGPDEFPRVLTTPRGPLLDDLVP